MPPLVVDLKIDIDDFKRWHFLGKGSFGVVYKALYHDAETKDSFPIAIKRSNDNTDSCQKKWDHEVKINRYLMNNEDRPGKNNIVRFFGEQVDKNGFNYIFIECLPFSLTAILVDDRQYADDKFPGLSIAHGLAQGLAYIHDLHILHRDLKSDNILLTEKLEPKISDFGEAIIRETGTVPLEGNQRGRLRVGTYRWMAPEVLKGLQNSRENYSHKADIFSMAVVLWQLFSRKEKPYAAVGDEMSAIQMHVLVKKQRESFAATKAPTWYQALIESAWKHEFELRPEAREIVRIIKDNSPQPHAGNAVDEQAGTEDDLFVVDIDSQARSEAEQQIVRVKNFEKLFKQFITEPTVMRLGKKELNQLLADVNVLIEAEQSQLQLYVYRGVIQFYLKDVEAAKTDLNKLSTDKLAKRYLEKIEVQRESERHYLHCCGLFANYKTKGKRQAYQLSSQSGGNTTTLHN